MKPIHQKLQIAFEQQKVVEISYRDQKGNETRRMIRPLEWEETPGGLVIRAYDYLREDNRRFRLKGIMHCRNVGPSRHPGKPPGLIERTIEFPSKRSLGLVCLFKDGQNPFDFGWSLQRIGNARGIKTIPEDKKVSLWASHIFRTDSGDRVEGPSFDPSYLSKLKPNDLQAINLCGKIRSDDNLVHIEHLYGLEWLWLQSCTITNKGLSIIGGLRNLRFLSFHGNFFKKKLIGDRSSIDDRGLVNLRDLIHLRCLECYKTTITDEGLKNFIKMRDLKKLHLSGSLITGYGLRHLVDVMNLEGLGLAGTSLSDETTKYIGKFKNLKVLTLDDTAISDKGLFNLQGLVKLDQLNLSRTNITNDGLRYLKNMKDLSFLSVHNTAVTKEGLETHELADRLYVQY